MVKEVFMGSYQHPSNLSIIVQGDLIKQAKHLVSQLENNTDENSWSNFSSVARSIAQAGIVEPQASGFMLLKVLEQLEKRIQSAVLHSPIEEFQELSFSGKLSKEGKHLLMQTVIEEQQKYYPMDIAKSTAFNQCLIEAATEYEPDKILTFEWVDL